MATITTLGATDSGSTSRNTINTNFSNLNNQVKIIYKSADETVNNSTTLQDDDHLTFAIGVNEVWAFDFFLKYSTGATPDLKLNFALPAGATMNTMTQFDFDEYNEASFPSLFPGDASGLQLEHFVGVITNSTTSGTVQIQWAQNTLDASDTKVLKGSYIIAHKLA